ncbi:hypothetical protein EV715DRAFT_292220 [Schizophyllum commune]
MPSTIISPSTKSSASMHRRAADRVPTEILSMIFNAALLPDAVALWDRRLEAMWVALAVSQVCRRWRQISCSAPQLWKNITIGLPFTTGKRALVALSLARSGSVPLDINLDVRNPDYDGDNDVPPGGPQEMLDCLELIVPHAQRWGNLDVICDTLPVMRAFLERTKDIRPRQLARIALMRPNPLFAALGMDPEPDELDSLPLFSGSLPALKEVALHGAHVDWASPALQDLAHLDLRFQTEFVMPSWERFVDVARASPHLQSLALVGCGPDLDEIHTCRAAPTTDTLVFPSLTAFSLGYLDAESARKLLGLISMPQLQHLTIEDADYLHGPGDARGDSTPLIASLAQRSPRATSRPPGAALNLARITDLELVTVRASEAAFARLFSGLLALEELRLVKMQPDIFSALAPTELPARGKEIRPCAKLRRIECRHMDASSLIPVLHKRRVAAAEGTPVPNFVQALTLRDCLSLAAEELDAFRSLGIRVIIERYEDDLSDMNSEGDDDDSYEDL